MKKRLLTLALVAVGAAALVRWVGGGGGDASDGGSDPSLILDRLWVDQLPTRPKDTANIFVAITRQSMGIFQSASQWKGGYEIFKYTASGSELRLVYPQTDEKEKVKARAWQCKKRDMDYCLELTGASRGVKQYYSQNGWEVDGASTPAQLLDRVAALAARRH
jgi:hypothetical protein